ncbi:MAG: 30S ribosomal protein S7 [Candidatus Altiarchaeota archaeon]|nr:30S ribosomal protein S7 [Candidatus Altiarchaeota archaeon]
METDFKLFGKWDYDVEIVDVGLRPYMNINPMSVPDSRGRHTKKRFWKAEKVSIVERMINKIMRSGQGSKKFGGKYIRGTGATGKKSLAMKIVEGAFDIVAQKTNDNPVQVLVDAVQNAAPREETTTIIYGGVHYHQAVDIASQRRIDLALKNIVVAAYANSFNSKGSIQASLAEEIITTANNDPKSYAIKKKEETERIALSSR